MKVLYRLSAKASPTLYSSTSNKNAAAPFWLSNSCRGSHTASARVGGGCPGTSGSGAQSVASMVAAMRNATIKKAKRQPAAAPTRGSSHAAISTSTAPASIAADAIAEGGGRGGERPFARRNHIDAVGIEHDILRGGQESDQQRHGAEHVGFLRRRAESHDPDAKSPGTPGTPKSSRGAGPTTAAGIGRAAAPTRNLKMYGRPASPNMPMVLMSSPADASQACKVNPVRLKGNPEAKLSSRMAVIRLSPSACSTVGLETSDMARDSIRAHDLGISN